MKVSLSGENALLSSLSRVPEKIRDKVLATALKQFASQLVAIERAAAPADSGLLRRSIGAGPTRNYARPGGWLVYMATGPRFGFKRAVVRRKGGKGFRALGKGRSAAATGGKFRNPAMYAHLVEHGHRIAVGGTLARIPRPGFTRLPVMKLVGRGSFSHKRIGSPANPTIGSYQSWSRLVRVSSVKQWTPEKVWMPRIGGGGIFAYLHGHPGQAAVSKKTGVAGGGHSIGRVMPRPFMAAAEAMAPMINESIARAVSELVLAEVFGKSK